MNLQISPKTLTLIIVGLIICILLLLNYVFSNRENKNIIDILQQENTNLRTNIDSLKKGSVLIAKAREKEKDTLRLLEVKHKKLVQRDIKNTKELALIKLQDSKIPDDSTHIILKESFIEDNPDKDTTKTNIERWSITQYHQNLQLHKIINGKDSIINNDIHRLRIKDHIIDTYKLDSANFIGRETKYEQIIHNDLKIIAQKDKVIKKKNVEIIILEAVLVGVIYLAITK